MRFTVLACLAFTITTIHAEPAPAPTLKWTEKYYACFDAIPDSTGDDPILGIHAQQLRTAADQTKRALGELLENGKVIWTGSDPNDMTMRFLTRGEIISIPHNGTTVKYTRSRRVGGDDVTDYEHAMKVVDQEGRLPPFYPEAAISERTNQRGQKHVSAHVPFFFSERGRVDDKQYKVVPLSRSQDDTVRQAIREELITRIGSVNRSYEAKRHGLEYAAAVAPGALLDVDRERARFLGGMKACLSQFPAGEKEDKSVRGALVTAIAKFEEQFKVESGGNDGGKKEH